MLMTKNQLKMAHSNTTLLGTAGGTFLSILPTISSEDVLKTVLLASVGAVVSFTLSLVLNYLFKKHEK